MSETLRGGVADCRPEELARLLTFSPTSPLLTALASFLNSIADSSGRLVTLSSTTGDPSEDAEKGLWVLRS